LPYWYVMLPLSIVLMVATLFILKKVTSKAKNEIKTESQE